MSIDRSRRDLFIDVLVDSFILKNNQITLSRCFTFNLKLGVGTKTGVSFYCVSWVLPSFSHEKQASRQVTYMTATSVYKHHLS